MTTLGRLFWKFFLAFWLSLLIGGLGAAGVLWLHRVTEGEPADAPPGGGRGGFALRVAVSTFDAGGPEVLRKLLADLEQERPSPLRVIDPLGRELLGREVTPEDVAGARRDLAQRPDALARSVTTAEGEYLFFIAPGMAPPGPPRHPHDRPTPWLPISAALIASLAFSAFGAWYLSKPIRNLRWAFNAVAQGRLDARVAPRMGTRRDEVADLGHDFDRMAQHLQALVGAQRRLLHDVSHELRSPLARLTAAIGLARQNPARAEDSFERIEREAARLDHLVGELLTLSRLEASTDPLRRERIDLVELLAGVCEDARFEAQAKGRELTFNGEGTLELDANPELLHRALENVVRNAVKFTAEGSTVEVSIDPHLRGNLARVIVSDRGPGVPEAELEAIFKPFYRGANAQAAGGFGLGLAIARRALEAHAGSLTLRNREGGGLVVELQLPVVASA